MPNAAVLFPEELIDSELALSVGKYTWNKVIKRTKESTESKVVNLKVRIKKDSCKHIYKFNSPPPQQLLGLFASALEIINEKKIITFKPTENKLVITFSTEDFIDGDDEE